MLIENLENVEYQTIHSGRSINDDILPELNKLVEDFNALTPEQQTTVLKDMNYSATTSSTATRNALRAAITQVLADEEAAIGAALEAINEMTGVISGIVDRDIAALHGEDEEELDELDITFLEDVIKEAIAAKEGIVISEDGSNVPVGTYWVTQEDMDALNAAIDAAEAAKGTVEIQQDVAEAAKALEAAVSTFNDAKQEAIDDEKELEETEAPVNEQESDTENDEATTEETVEEVSGEEITEESAIETDESQLEGDAEVIEEAGEEEAA